jgi:glyceraldehyde 3-phosphate dehydrogenase
MAIRIGINGFGRIGRTVLRIMEQRSDFEVVMVNDLSAPEALAHLFKYDTVMGRFDGDVEGRTDSLVVKGREIKVTAERDPANLPWKSEAVDFVVEATGVFRKRSQIAAHLAAGAPKVILTVPPKDELDAIVVLGVNDDDLKPEHQIVSNASCTTNCLAPLAKVLHDSFEITKGTMNTIHAYTSDQSLVDGPHSDLRRARAAALNIIPTSTGAARAVGQVMPALKGKLDGFSLRVPVPDGSVVDLVATLKKKTTVEKVNAALAAAAKKGPMKGILGYTEDPIVSTDIIHDPHSSILDAGMTQMIDKRMVKIIAWYDNEWGYSNRMVDLMLKVSKM